MASKFLKRKDIILILSGMPKTEPFDKHAEEYEDWFERNPLAYASELEAIRKLLPPDGIGMEIGVGSGRFAAPLGIKKGIEPSARMREIAASRGIDAINGIAEDLPFKDSEFDFLLMVTTICFLDDVKSALKEAYRVLKEGGSLIIGFIDKDSFLGRLYQKKKKKSLFYGEANFYSVLELIKLLEEAGFGNFRFVQTIFKPLDEIKEVEPVKEGYGEGSFVVIRAVKSLQRPRKKIK